MTVLDVVLLYDQELRDQGRDPFSSEVWLHQADGAALFSEVARRSFPIKRACLMSDPAPCLELLSGLRVFSKIMNDRKRQTLFSQLKASGATPYVTTYPRSYGIYGRRQPRVGWLHGGRVALRIRCTVHSDCRARPKLGYACLAATLTTSEEKP